MRTRSLALIVLTVVCLLTVGLAPAAATATEPVALVQIAVPQPADLAAVEAAGVPVYARLEGTSGPYFLAGASPKQAASLRDDGISVVVLDSDTSGAGYYLAYAMPGRPRPEWSGYGTMLLDDGVQVLLRTSPEQAGRLAEAGVELRAVTLDPKPVRPALVEGAIPAVIEPDPLIQSMIDQIDLDIVYNYTGDISGQWPVDIGGVPYTILTRNTYSGTPIQKATQFAGEHLEALGLDVEYHTWSSPQYPNVIGELPGLINPDEIWIICGHIDDMPSSGNAPGADDNGSGTVAVLLAADILTQFQWGSTLRFALWTGEEQGLLGSHAYAQRAFNNGENIAGVLNLDMIAWNSGGSSPNIDIHAEQSLPPTLQLAQLMADVVDAYNLNLIPEIDPTGTGASDHASFWEYGYTAILGIEDFGDFNPYYHTTQDDMDNFEDWPYYVEFVKASVATFAHMSGSLIPSGIGSLEGHVTAASGGAPIAGATVSMTDPQAHTYSATTDTGGYYTRILLENTYDVTASAYGYLPVTVTGVEVMTDTVTTQDFSLPSAPAYVVKGTVTDSVSGAPLLAEIEFQGSPVTATTDPVSGRYRVTLPQGTYTMYVTAADHRPQERPIVVDQGQIQDFALEPLPCILLVDDDNDNPDTAPYFTAALDTLGYDYDLFDTSGGSGPGLDGLQGYKMVIWFSGDTYGGTAGPNGTDETNLAAYLDGGGRLFLSSQDYLYDVGLTSFGQNYLGIGSYTDDSGNATVKYGVAGDPIGSGLGPYNLTYPSGYSDYGDIVNPGTGASVAFTSAAGGGGNKLDIDKALGEWKTVFFGTDWVAIYNNNAANGVQVLGTIIDWFGGCEEPPTVHVGTIKMTFQDLGGRYLVFGTPKVLDQDGAAVPGALVSGQWTLPDGSTLDQQGTTGATGAVRFRAKSTQTGTYQFCVTDVSKTGYTYDPAQNGETCDSITVP